MAVTQWGYHMTITVPNDSVKPISIIMHIRNHLTYMNKCRKSKLKQLKEFACEMCAMT